MFCNHCGAQNPDGALFCSACGQSVSGGVQINIHQQINNRQQVRAAELAEMERMLRYFSQKGEQYAEYDRLAQQMVRLSKGKHYSLLVWGIIIAVFGSLIYFGTFSQMDNVQKGVLAVALLVPGAAMIVGHVFYAKYFDGNRARAVQRFNEVGAELTAHYQHYGLCSVGAEYTNPANLSVIYDTLQSGRADTIKEAINILVDDAYRSNMQHYAAQTARNTAAAARGASAATVFAAANFFLR